MRILIVAIAATALAACSTPAPQGPVAATAPATTGRAAAASPSETLSHVECGDPQISQEEYAAHCAAATAKPLIKIARGKAFNYLDKPMNTAPVQWRVKVRRLTCWKAIPNGIYIGDGKFGTARPAKGKKFCVLSSIHTNTGKTPGSPSTFDAIMTDKGQFAQAHGDSDVEDAIAQQNDDARYYETWTNPGDTTVKYQVWSVPAGASPTAALFPFATVFDGPKFEVALPKVTA